MKVNAIGTLSNVTGTSWGSGTSTPPIDLSRIVGSPEACIWLSVEGDLGRSATSISLMMKGSPSRAGSTYTAFLRENLSHVTGSMLVKSGTSKTGQFGDGSYLKRFTPSMPFGKLEAIHDGAGTTNNLSIKYAIVG